MDSPIVLFDGVCNLCNAAVRWILQRELRPELKFAPLQGRHANLLLRTSDITQSDEQTFESIIFIDTTGLVYRASDAALEICRYLRRPWRWLAWFRLVPRPVRDAAYRLIARRRYQWFGKQTDCMVPSPELRIRFLD